MELNRFGTAFRRLGATGENVPYLSPDLGRHVGRPSFADDTVNERS